MNEHPSPFEFKNDDGSDVDAPIPYVLGPLIDVDRSVAEAYGIDAGYRILSQGEEVGS